MRTNILILVTAVLAAASLTHAADAARLFRREVNNASMRKARTYVHAIVNSVLEGDLKKIADYGEKLDELEMIKGTVDPQQYEGEQRVLAAQFVQFNDDYHKAVKVLIDSARANDVEATFRVAEDITRSCVVCHAAFGQNKFPAFREIPVMSGE